MKQAISFIFKVMTVGASVVTFVFAYSRWYPHASTSAKPAIAILAALVAALLVLLIWREVVYARKARYSEILGLLNDIHTVLHGLALDRPVSTNEIREACIRISNLLAEAFSLITGTKCSVCVKVLEAEALDEDDKRVRPKVVTLCRDDHTDKRRRVADSKSEIPHWIDQNTDFFVLHQEAGTPKENWFLSNNLPSLRGYVNTSFQIYGKPSEGLLLHKWLPAFTTWPLPYKSTLVLPVRSGSCNGVKSPRLAGYLCVDSRSRGVFSRRYDPEVLSGVADSLYPALIGYWTMLLEKRKETP